MQTLQNKYEGINCDIWMLLIDINNQNIKSLHKRRNSYEKGDHSYHCSSKAGY